MRQVIQYMLFDNHFKVTDDILSTFFCQVEAIVNSRPISPLANSPNDEQALRPIDLLVPKCNVVSIPVDSTTSNSYTINWKRIHAMLDCFGDDGFGSICQCSSNEVSGCKKRKI